ncbi:MAG: PKD domain-containing protein, partial [Verrucomicrobiia bacterium]
MPAAAVLAGTAGAQTLVDLGATAPTPGTNDISQLSTLGNRTDPDGLNYYTDNQTSFGTGEPGQTFLTGTNPAGYFLSSLAIRTAGLGSDSGIGTAQPYYLHLYSLSGSTVTPLQTNTSANITFNDGDWLQWNGLSVPLAPNTTYAWSFGKASSTSGWEAMAVATNHPYAAGQIGLFPPGGGTVTFGSSHDFDAVFDVGLNTRGSSYLPPGWSDADIGSPGLAGSAGYTNGLWTVTGGGSDIWGTADQFNFCSTNFTGDGTMIALVTSLQNSDPSSGWSKAGLMFRNDSTPSSVNVNIVATAGQGVSFQWRSSEGGSSSDSQDSGITAPVWLKLVRSSGTFTGFYSMNGSSWVQVSSQTVAMNNTVLAGFDVTAHNNSALNTATFTNFTLTNIPSAPYASTPVVSPSSVISLGSTVTITSSATGGQPLSYQWQTDGGSGGTLTNIPGATSLSLTYTPPSSGTFQFDLVVTNSLGTVTSAIVAVTVLPLSATAPFTSDDYLIFTCYSNNVYGTTVYNNQWYDSGSWVTHYLTYNPNFNGSNSMVFAASGAWQAWQLTHDPIDTTIYANISFWLNGGTTGGQSVGIKAEAGSTWQNIIYVTAPANKWQQFTFSLASLGVANITNLAGIEIWNSSTVQPQFYIANIRLGAAPKPPVVHVGVNAAAPVRTVDARVFGINNVAWDGEEDAPGTIDQVTNMGIGALRWPGGSWGDGYHWTNEAMQYGNTSPRTWGSFTTNFIHTATNAQAQAFIIANYGSSTPEEAAWGVAEMNITNHANFKYWEIGNEVGGSWELDCNTNPPWQPHDPWTYAMRFAQYYAQMKAVDPTIKIGAVADTTEDGTSNYNNHAAVNPVTGVTHYGWTPVMLYTMRTNNPNALPDFLIEHNYAPSDGDLYNLLWAKQWVIDAANLRMMLNDYVGYYLGTNIATNIELCGTEYGPGGDKTPMSLVGGLFQDDTIGQILQTEFNAFLRWDLHNGQSDLTSSDNAVSGWRTDPNTGDYLSDG